MKKFSFLIPVAMAAAALSGEVAAKAVDTTAPTGSDKATNIANTQVPGAKESFYVKDGELHSLMMKPTASGQVLAWHTSHASHASHSSHSSHYSHRSGY